MFVSFINKLKSRRVNLNLYVVSGDGPSMTTAIGPSITSPNLKINMINFLLMY